MCISHPRRGGDPYAVVFLFVLVFLARRFDLLSETLAAFGGAFSVVAARFAIPVLARGELASTFYFAAVLAIGPGLIVAAIVLRRPMRWFRR